MNHFVSHSAKQAWANVAGVTLLGSNSTLLLFKARWLHVSSSSLPLPTCIDNISQAHRYTQWLLLKTGNIWWMEFNTLFILIRYTKSQTIMHSFVYYSIYCKVIREHWSLFIDFTFWVNPKRSASGSILPNMHNTVSLLHFYLSLTQGSSWSLPWLPSFSFLFNNFNISSTMVLTAIQILKYLTCQ